MDYLAIVSQGIFATSIPDATTRAAFAISRGLLRVLPSPGDTKVKFIRVILNSVGLIAVRLIKVFRP